jgi:hypothetical protein
MSTAEALHASELHIVEQSESVEGRLSRLWVIEGGAGTEAAPEADRPAAPASPSRRQQLEWFATVREEITTLAGNDDWSDDAVARKLLLRLFLLEQAVSADDGDDAEWHVREHVTVMVDLLKLMQRRIEHADLDKPTEAAKFVASTLSDLDDREIAPLLGVDPKTVANWREGKVGAVRKNPDRVVLVAQLLYELRSSWTSRGLLMWFSSEHPQLGRPPIELMAEDLGRHAETLRSLARAERGQLGA